MGSGQGYDSFVASVTNSSLARLSASLTEEFFVHKIFTDSNQCFTPNDEGDRFVRPLDPISLGDFDRMIEPITQRSYRTRGFFPSIGTSSDQQFLYYGLRVRGFGSDGVADAGAIWRTLDTVKNLNSALDYAFGETWVSLGECWIAFSSLSDVPVNGDMDKDSIACLAEKLVNFTLRLCGDSHIQR